jgi:hypothetical protein
MTVTVRTAGGPTAVGDYARRHARVPPVGIVSVTAPSDLRGAVAFVSVEAWIPWLLLGIERAWPPPACVASARGRSPGSR